MSNHPPILYTPSDDEPLSIAVIEAVSHAKGRDISQDDTLLYDNINPDALDALFQNEQNSQNVELEFNTHNVDVTIHRNGDLTIEATVLDPP